MSSNPYADLPDHRFWRKAVAGLPPFAIDPIVDLPFRIAPTDKVATGGSCFAQHLAKRLQQSGFHYYQVEQAPAGMSAAEADHLQYGVYSGRYGNIYTTRQLLQLFDRAFGHFKPDLDVWERKDGRFVDPFRPRVNPDGFATPEEVRAQRSLANLDLTEPLSLDKSRAKSLKPPRMADSTVMTIAGLTQTLTFENMAAISAIWQRFVPHIGHVPQESPGAAYGVCFNMTDSGMDYVAGVAVKAGADLPKGFVTVKVPAGRYAVFRHDGHISRVGDSWGAIWGGGLEAAGLKAAATPIFERYGPEFDGRTGEGGLELWVPIEGS